MSEPPPEIPTPFDAAGGLLFALRLNNPIEPVSWNDLERAEPQCPLWMHFDRTRAHAQEWLRDRSGLDPLAIDALLADETRPRATEFDRGLLIMLRAVNLNPGAEPDDLVSLRCWLDSSRLITLRQRPLHSVAEVHQRIVRRQGPGSSGSVLSSLALAIALSLGVVLEDLEDPLDHADEALSDARPEAVSISQLADVRREAARLRRYLAPQRDTLTHLVISGNPLIDAGARRELLEAADQNARIVEHLEEIRDRAAVTQDEYRAVRELRQSRTMYLLTLIAAVFLPLSFLTGLLGINVGGIPGADNPTAFWIVAISLLSLAGVLVVAFKKLHWI
ncbi:MAG: zinc transporter ZntB [Phycisphaerales bacterium]|nr:zinc transporter ZntB [Phycisphaerales bacterium]